MDECPHGGYPHTCPPCRRGDHVVPREAKRMSIPVGRKTTMLGSRMCRGGEKRHLLKAGETGVWNGVSWNCEEHA